MEHLIADSNECYGLTSTQFLTKLLNGIRQLKSFKIGLCFHDARMPASVLLDLIKDKPSITKLVLDFECFWDMQVDLADATRIVTEHSALTDLKLMSCQLSTEVAVALTRQMNLLKKIEIRTNYHELLPQLNDGWKISTGLFTLNSRYPIVTLNR